MRCIPRSNGWRGTSAADERLGDNALIEKAATSQLAAITCPSSRFFGRLPKTEIDLNSSMCALSCRQSCESQTITGARDYLRPAAVVFVMVPLASSSLRAQMNAPPRPPGTRVRTYTVLSHTVAGSS